MTKPTFKCFETTELACATGRRLKMRNIKTNQPYGNQVIISFANLFVFFRKTGAYFLENILRAHLTDARVPPWISGARTAFNRFYFFLFLLRRIRFAASGVINGPRCTDIRLFFSRPYQKNAKNNYIGLDRERIDDRIIDIIIIFITRTVFRNTTTPSVNGTVCVTIVNAVRRALARGCSRLDMWPPRSTTAGIRRCFPPSFPLSFLSFFFPYFLKG